MAHPRGLIERELLGRKRRLRAPLQFPGEYELRTGQPFGEFMAEFMALQKNPWSYNADHLLAAVAVLCEGGDDPIEDEELESATFGDVLEILAAIDAAFEATGLIDKVPGGAEKKAATKKPKATGNRASRRSRGKSGDK